MDGGAPPPLEWKAKLEEELKEKDRIIAELRSRLEELERKSDEKTVSKNPSFLTRSVRIDETLLSDVVQRKNSIQQSSQVEYWKAKYFTVREELDQERFEECEILFPEV